LVHGEKFEVCEDIKSVAQDAFLPAPTQKKIIELGGAGQNQCCTRGKAYKDVTFKILFKVSLTNIL